MTHSAKRKWIVLFSVLFGVLLIGEVAGRLLIAQESVAIGNWVRTIAWFLVDAWLIWNLWRVRQFRYAKELLTMSVGSNIVAGVALTLFFKTDYQGTAIATLGSWTMICLFIIGLWAIRVVLSSSTPIAGVARTCLDEAIRMKVALVFIIALVLVVPLLPFALDPEEQLRYRVQFFMTWSLMGTSILLGFLTVFLSCATICNEISQRQIHMTMVKPITRAQYLMGKWLGISLLNLLLVTIAGGTTYVMVRMLQQQPALGYLDRTGVDDQLLAARASIMPRPLNPKFLKDKYDERVATIKNENPDAFFGKDVPPPGVSREIESMVLAQWHTIGPGNTQVFVFKDLNDAKKYGARTIQFRYKPDVRPRPEDLMVRLSMKLNDRPYPINPRTGRPQTIKSAVREFNTLDLPLEALDEDGTLRISIRNMDVTFPDQSHKESILFGPNSDIEVLYHVGNFEMNLARAVFILWMRLVFLAILGLMAGTFLGFPVASLFSLFMYGVAVSSAYLMFSLSWFGTSSFRHLPFWERMQALTNYCLQMIGQGRFGDALELLVRIGCEFLVMFIPSFSSADPLVDVADGKLVSYAAVGNAVLWLGLIWSGGLAFIAWLIFRRRELARVII
jgi:hypothetical protein